VDSVLGVPLRVWVCGVHRARSWLGMGFEAHVVGLFFGFLGPVPRIGLFRVGVSPRGFSSKLTRGRWRDVWH